MTCEQCKDIVDRPDLPHSVRKCPNCGRTMYVHESGKGGKGIQIREGDTFVIPSSWLKLSLSPLKSRGRFFKRGIQWFAELIFLENLPSNKEAILEEIQKTRKEFKELLRASDLIGDLDIDNPDHADQIIDILQSRKDTAEWWVFLGGYFYSILDDAIKSGDVQLAIWASACAERCRSMYVFKEHLEEVVWMGQSARQLIDILRLWDANRSNDDESFWHGLFSEHSYALSQLLSVPVVFIGDNAYVGGMSIERTNARFVDYLFSAESSHEAILIEIKTPTTRLLGSKYRGVFRPSSDLSGSVVQVLDYRSELVRSLEKVLHGTTHNLEAFNPSCVLVIGDGEAELTDDSKRKSFELFRRELKDIQIITYDELFRKLEVLASLFNLIRQKDATDQGDESAA